MNRFIGVDLGWYGKSSGLASISSDGPKLPLQNSARLEAVDEIQRWIQSEAARAPQATAAI
jgi:predicted RNase H-like nuclease